MRPSLLLVLAVSARAHAQWVIQPSGTEADLRGLSVVSPRVVWASGAHGTVLHTANGGQTWTVDTIPGASTLDLRAIAATSASVAHAMSIADSSRIFRTVDGGRTWSLRYVSVRPGSFFDALRFSDAQHGIVMSDPVDGRFLLVSTHDGGDTWKEVPADRLPSTLAGERAYAAGGSGVATFGREVWFGSGGAASARVFHSADRGSTWSASDTPIRAGVRSAGIFSIAFRDAKHGVIAGGLPATRLARTEPRPDGRRRGNLDRRRQRDIAGGLSVVRHLRAGDARQAAGRGRPERNRRLERRWPDLDFRGYRGVQRSVVCVENGWLCGRRSGPDRAVRGEAAVASAAATGRRRS